MHTIRKLKSLVILLQGTNLELISDEFLRLAIVSHLRQVWHLLEVLHNSLIATSTISYVHEV